MSRHDSKRLKAVFNGEEHTVTLEQQVMSTALAIEALEKLLISQGILKAGDLEKAVDDLLKEKTAGTERLIELLH